MENKQKLLDEGRKLGEKLDALADLVIAESEREHEHTPGLCPSCRLIMGLQRSTRLKLMATEALIGLEALNVDPTFSLLAVCVTVGMRLQQEIHLKELAGDL